MAQTLTPREIIFRYIDRNTTGESGMVTVRGVYSKNENDPRQSRQTVFDRLVDEMGDYALKVSVPKGLRAFLRNGDTVELTGTVSDYGFRETGILQVQLNVLDCAQAKDLFIPKAENDRHRIRRGKAMKGYRDVRGILSGIIRDGGTPSVAMVYPAQTVAHTDFERAAGDAMRYYRFEYRNVPFSDPAAVVRVLQECDKRYDLVCIVRGGGSGLQSLDDTGILAQVAGMATPVLTAVGHAEDNLFIDSVADLRKETPSLLGTFFREVVQEKLHYKRLMDEQARRIGVLTKVAVLLGAVLAAAVAALFVMALR